MITNQTTATVKELALILGISERRVHQLRVNGLITKSGKSYNLIECVHAYLEHSIMIAGEKKAAVPDETVKEKRDADIALKEKRATKTDVDAESKRLDNELKRLRLKEMQNELCSYKAFEFIFSDYAIAFKQRMMAIPGRTAIDVYNAESPAECAEIVKAEIYAALNELAEKEFNKDKLNDVLEKYDMYVTY